MKLKLDFLKIISSNLKSFIRKFLRLLNVVASIFFKSSRILASIYYAGLSAKFSREHQAVLSGKAAYQKTLSEIGDTSFMLRRNTHRLEKGLIMEPRRAVFAENFIEETVKTFRRATILDCLNREEEKWIYDVLTEYFSIVDESQVIKKARLIFDEISRDYQSEKKYTPYPFDDLPESDISYGELRKLFIKRRSVRWYQDKYVPHDLIEKAVEIASFAPSACNRQPYSFYVSDNKEKAIEIAKCAGGTAGWADNIPCTIAVVGDLSAYPEERDRHIIYIDGSLAAMQLMLALETMGLSSCSINWADVEKAEKRIRKLLNLKIYQRPIMLLSIGYAQTKGGIPFSQKKDPKILIKKV